ncbi:lipoyl protein ligase domain-containing protein [Tepidibacillus sp. HK-1]|uniref:lipoate--protein ligase family protein n=1 Tax=Tepidibacillus sp. HK-1 TaxID=1883407 RepID=UPI00085378E6|nr:hypothetical protein [Tepidibacillus sp. HK-1]GBF12095.1 lipoyl-[GcvH]:protein N-lipoyltransferase [Tepidibacillus sp. HK-1]
MPIVIDRIKNERIPSILYPFAFEEELCQKVGDGHEPIIHIWQHSKAFVMGLRDSRLPHAGKAKLWLHDQGYEVMVRHSGGAAVPLDNGVINISLIQPIKGQIYRFQQDFEIIFQLIKDTLQSYPVRIEKGEIKGSYCPGDYDLSINHRKFCGIAQRRQLKAFIVHAFINVLGIGAEKAKLVQQFYEIASGGRIEEFNVPSIQPEKITTLKELTNVSSIEEFLFHLKIALKNKYGDKLIYENAQSFDTLHENEINKMMVEFKTKYDITQ